MGIALGAWSSRHAQRCALLLLLAWLPTLTFVGHWEGLAAPFTSGGATSTHAHTSPSRSSDPEHAQHCHTGFDECGGGASSVTMPGGPPVQIESRAPGGTATDIVVVNEYPPLGFESSPLTPPPRHIA